jgi:hypothetical protein
MSAFGLKQPWASAPHMSAFRGKCVAKLFWGAAGEILIQHQTKTRNVDSQHRPAGFDYCAFEVQQRVLQHIEG